MEDKKGKKIVCQVLITIFALLSALSVFVPFFEVGIWGYGTTFSLVDIFDMGELEFVMEFANGGTNTFEVLKAITIGLLVCAVLVALCAWIGKRGACWLIILIGLLETAIAGVFIADTLMYSSYIGESITSQIGNYLCLAAGIGMFFVAILLRNACIKKVSIQGGLDETQNLGHLEGKIVGVMGEYDGDEIPVDDTPVVIGRDPSCSNLILQEDKVSRKHCSVAFDAERNLYIVKDYSSNGTFLTDGTALNAEKANELQPGTEIRIGEGQVFVLG